MSGKHSEQTVNHVVHAFTYADAAARLAATGLVSTDVGKVAKQTDTGQYYVLTATTPVWQLIGGKDTLYGNREVDHTVDITWYTVYADGLATGFPVPADTAFVGNISVIGLTAGATQRWAYTITNVAIVNDGGTTTLLGAGTVNTISETDAAYDVQVVANDTDDTIEVQARRNGGVAYTVKWVVRLDIARVTNA